MVITNLFFYKIVTKVVLSCQWIWHGKCPTHWYTFYQNYCSSKICNTLTSFNFYNLWKGPKHNSSITEKKYLWKGQSESTYRHNNWLVLIEERLITGGGVNNCESLMSQVAITVLVQSTPVWATMLQSMKGQNKTKIISNWNSTFVQPKKLLIIFYHKFFCFFFAEYLFYQKLLCLC